MIQSYDTEQCEHNLANSFLSQRFTREELEQNKYLSVAAYRTIRVMKERYFSPEESFFGEEVTQIGAVHLEYLDPNDRFSHLQQRNTSIAYKPKPTFKYPDKIRFNFAVTRDVAIQNEYLEDLASYGEDRTFAIVYLVSLSEEMINAELNTLLDSSKRTITHAELRSIVNHELMSRGTFFNDRADDANRGMWTAFMRRPDKQDCFLRAKVDLTGWLSDCAINSVQSGTYNVVQRLTDPQNRLILPVR